MSIDQSLTILHDDPVFVVIDKPGGLLSVPGRGADKQDCVTARLRALYPHMIAQPSVHRLDMYTSGVMVYAKSKEAHRHLSIQFERRLVNKIYIALLEGIVLEEKGTITLPFRLDPDNRPYQVYDEEKGKVGISQWRKLGIENGFTRIEFIPLTGRTHQLRLHASHPKGLGVPIVGDKLYGNGQEGDRMFLHAHTLSFNHPVSEKKMFFSADLPF